jgi:hypothetical protein
MSAEPLDLGVFLLAGIGFARRPANGSGVHQTGAGLWLA